MSNRKVLSLSLPYSLLKEIHEIAKDEEITKSELLRQAIRDFMGRRKWEKAKKAGRRAVRQMKITEADIEDIVHAYREKKA